MEPTTTPSLLGEVRDFLSTLKKDWPDLFTSAKRPKVRALAPRPTLIAAVAADAPLKTALPEGVLVDVFRSRAEYWAPFLGVSFGRVSVKDQRTLWGSCSRAGNLNFSWRLALAPDAVLDYLIVHELAHRAQMNHSRRFWAAVETVCPAHRSHRRWLRRNAAALHAAAR